MRTNREKQIPSNYPIRYYHMKALHMIVTMAICLFPIGCRERDSDNSNRINTSRSSSRSGKMGESAPGGTREDLAARHQSTDAESARKILANCEKLKLGDGTGALDYGSLKRAYKELAALDLNLALAQFGDSKAFYSLAPALSGVLQVAAAKDPDLLVDWLNETTSKYDDKQRAVPLISMALCELATANPEKALAAFKSMDVSAAAKESVISAIFRGVAANDPSSVIARSASLDPSIVSAALAGAADGAFKRDPSAAKAIASEIPDSATRQSALDGVFYNWFKADPSLACDELMKMDRKAIEDMLVSGSQNPRSALFGISQSAPLKLLSLLDEFCPTKVNEDLYKSAIAQTVKGQPEQTLATISRLPNGEMKAGLYKEAYATLTRSDPERAMAMFALQKDPAVRAVALPEIAGAIGTGGMDASLRFIDQLSEEKEKSAAFSSAFGSVVHSDLESAADYLTNRGKQAIDLPPQERENGCKVVAYRLASNNISDAREWMSKLPIEEQHYAMTGIATQMAQRDVQELGRYLNTIEKDKAWAAGVQVLISMIEPGDADMANTWNQALKDAKLGSP
jgi:hypothetical protein